jgi:CRP/FNR family transcriptional regulator, cyclic AMP receptor protein
MSLSAKINPDPNQTCCKLTGDFDILRQLPLFSGANPEVIKLFAYLAKRRTYQSGDYLIETGKEADRALLLLCGEAEVTAVYKEKEIVMQKLAPKAFVGELALLAKFNWYFNLRACAETEVLSIDRQSFNKVLSQYPSRKEKIIEKIILLRVSRLKQQTNIYLDQLLKLESPDSPPPKMSL